MLTVKSPVREIFEKAIRTKTGKFTKNEIMELCPEIGSGSIEQSPKALCDEETLKKEGKARATFYYLAKN